MALSASTNASQNAGQLIRAALLKLGVVNPNSTVNDAVNNMCLDALNRMVKHWQMQGVHMWTQHEGAIVLKNGVASYTFANSSLAGATTGVVNADVLETTTLTTAAIAGATVLHVASTSGMAATDKILIELDSEVSHETTIVSVDSSTQVTITSGLASAAAVDQFVYSYPVALTQANQFYPKQIANVRLHYGTNQERMLTEFSRDEYFAKNNRLIAGTSFSYYLDDQLTNKVLYIFPVVTDMKQSLRFTYYKALDDIDALTNDVEFPVEAQKAIVLNLAVDVALEFGKEAKLNILLPLAKEALDDFLAWDDEKVNVQLIPDMGNY